MDIAQQQRIIILQKRGSLYSNREFTDKQKLYENVAGHANVVGEDCQQLFEMSNDHLCMYISCIRIHESPLRLTHIRGVVYQNFHQFGLVGHVSQCSQGALRFLGLQQVGPEHNTQVSLWHKVFCAVRCHPVTGGANRNVVS